MVMNHVNTAGAADNDFVIQYPRASKNFWRTGMVVNVSLLEHKRYDMIEIKCAIESPIVELTRIYVSTPLFFSKFSKKVIDERVAVKNAAIFDANTCRKNNSCRGDEDITSVYHDMAVKYVMLRLVVSLNGRPEMRLIALPGDSTKADGQLDHICEMPVGFKEYDSICSKIKNER